jgi:porphobilinogen deaminase
LLAALGGGCQLAVAAYADVFENRLRLRAASFVGAAARRVEGLGEITQATQLGERLAKELAAPK